MTVRFEATHEDLVDVHLRLQRHSEAARRIRRRDITITVAGGSIGVFVLILILSRGEDLGPASVISATTLIVTLVGYPRFHDWLIARRTREMLRDAMKPGERLPVEVELDESGVTVRSGKNVTHLAWDGLRAINDLPEGVEFLFGQGIVMTRSRAFESAEMRARFIQTARGFSGQQTGTLSSVDGPA